MWSPLQTSRFVAAKQHTCTHTVLTAIFPDEPGLAGCPLILLLHFILDCASFWDRHKLFMSFLTQSHQVFFGHPLCLIPSTSHVIQHLTQSLSSFRSTCPNHLNLLFLIIKLTGSNPNSSLEFFTFLPVIQLNPPHIHLIILISVRFIFNPCSTFIGQASLPCIRQLLTQVAYTMPFSFNENPFPVRMGRYSRNVFKADLTLAVTAESQSFICI